MWRALRLPNNPLDRIRWSKMMQIHLPTQQNGPKSSPRPPKMDPNQASDHPKLAPSSPRHPKMNPNHTPYPPPQKGQIQFPTPKNGLKPSQGHLKISPNHALDPPKSAQICELCGMTHMQGSNRPKIGQTRHELGWNKLKLGQTDPDYTCTQCH